MERVAWQRANRDLDVLPQGVAECHGKKKPEGGTGFQPVL
jgi:hypothetical protein